MPNVKLLEPEEFEKKNPCMIPVKGDLVVGDIVQWIEPSYVGGYDPRTRVQTGHRTIRAKVLAEETFNPSHGKSYYTLRVLESTGDSPLPRGKIIQKTAHVIFYLGETMRQPWPDESLRQEAMADKIERDNQAGS